MNRKRLALSVAAAAAVIYPVLTGSLSYSTLWWIKEAHDIAGLDWTIRAKLIEAWPLLTDAGLAAIIAFGAVMAAPYIGRRYLRWLQAE